MQLDQFPSQLVIFKVLLKQTLLTPFCWHSASFNHQALLRAICSQALDITAPAFACLQSFHL